MSSPARKCRSPAATSPYRFVVAMRLLRARKINIISILGVMVGVASIIVVMSVMDGFQKELRTKIRGTLSDFIIAINPESVVYEDLKRDVENVDGVEAMTIQYHTAVVVPIEYRELDGGRQSTMLVRLVGIEPDEEGRISDFLHYLENEPPDPDPRFPPNGQPPNPQPFPKDPFEVRNYPLDEDPRVVLSDWLAKRIGYATIGRRLVVGDTFVIVNLEDKGSDGSTDFVAHDRTVVISRIYESGNSEFDRLHVYVHRDRTRGQFFNRTNPFHTELRVKLADYSRQAEIRPELHKAVGAHDPFVRLHPEHAIETWEERQNALLSAVENEKFLLAFVLFFIVLVACFSIFATLTMTVVEKTRDIGVLRALGATPAGICSIFMINGALVGLMGAALGYGFGLYLTDNVNVVRTFLLEKFGWEIFPADIYLFTDIPTYVDHAAALSYAGAAAFSAFLFAIIPSIRAARFKPVSALRHE
ncbi:MAG: ABC transporter permease [Planctomycetota bacterium]|nr:ABC transporter permease [Planctomycetota bacterium]